MSVKVCAAPVAATTRRALRDAQRRAAAPAARAKPMGTALPPESTWPGGRRGTVRSDRGMVTSGETAVMDHLHPGAPPAALLPAGEPLRHVRTERWIGYCRAAEAVDRLEELLGWPARQRMPNLLLIGPTNNDKSMIVEKFRRPHPPISHPDREEIPVLVVQMPSEPSVIRFYVAVLAALGAPLRPRQRLAELDSQTEPGASSGAGTQCCTNTLHRHTRTSRSHRSHHR
jgi:hypothetical protein